MTNIYEVASQGDRAATLRALRDRLAQDIDDCTSTRDLPALVARMTDVLSQLNDLPDTKTVSKADEVAARRQARRAAAQK